MTGLEKALRGSIRSVAALVVGIGIGAASLGAAPAVAADMAVKAVTPVAPVEPWNPWQIRVRALGVVTNNSGSVDQIPGSGLKYSDSLTPELDISYYFNPNWAVELILGTTYANIYGTGSINGLNIGKVWLLPPTLTLQYHFTNFGNFQPYLGAGVNYTIFYNQDATDVNSISVNNAFGFALQAGFDYMIDRHWGWNVDVKWIYLEPSFDVNVGGAAMTGTANLNPWLISTGVTYRF